MEEKPITVPSPETQAKMEDSALPPVTSAPSLKKLAVLCVVCSVFTSLASVCVYQRIVREPQVRITKYDLAGYKERLIANVLAGRIPREEFGPRLADTFAKIAAAPPGVMVISADVALKNIPEYMPLDIPEVALPAQRSASPEEGTAR
jgi:hypothetical protein